MISFIKGLVIEMGARYVVVDVSGIGYKVFVTDDTLHALKNGGSATLHTYMAVRDDSMNLYGFLSKKEEEFFELLISVSSIGPKSAMNILSLVSPTSLSSAIRSGSTAHLVKVSGIGRKTAEKIVLELKDKLGTLSDGDMSQGMTSDMDAIEALRSLGYDADEAREALKKVDNSVTDTGAKVKAALKFIGK